MPKNIKVKVGRKVLEFYPNKKHGAYYQVGTNGEIGTFYFPMNKDGSADIGEYGPIEIRFPYDGGQLKFVYRGNEKFCATDEQHEMEFVYSPYLSSGKSYDCIHCDHFQVS